MKYRYSFILGRPGCGKSALYRALEKRLVDSGQVKTCERVDDFPKLWAQIQADDARQRKGKEPLFCRVDEHGGVEVTNHDVLKDILGQVLRKVSADVLKINKPDHMVFIEFARHSYLEALAHFDQAILDNCIVIYMDVDFEICWARNVARHQKAVAKGGDDHLVPRESMERYYLVDDRDDLVQTMRDRNIPIMVINNEADGEDQLINQVEALLAQLF